MTKTRHGFPRLVLRSATRAARQRCDVDAPREDLLRPTSRGWGPAELISGSILALPAVWAGAEPSQMVSTLVDTLIGSLHLSFVFVRLSALDRTPSIEIMRIADSEEATDRSARDS